MPQLPIFYLWAKVIYLCNISGTGAHHQIREYVKRFVSKPFIYFCDLNLPGSCHRRCYKSMPCMSRHFTVAYSCNLGQNKKEQLTPSPHKTVMKVGRSKIAPFWHHWNGGGGGGRSGPAVPFILSKIVVCSVMPSKIKIVTVQYMKDDWYIKNLA